MKPEIPGLLAMSAEQYHAHPAVGHTALVQLMRSPAHYQEYVSNPPEPTPAMQLGTAFHAALLEPERYKNDYLVAPKFDRRTKEGKSQAEAWEAQNAGKIQLSEEQAVAIEKMVASVREHAGAARLLAQGKAELSAFWVDSAGIECKCRPDFLSMAGETVTGIVDVKTCCDASATAFARAIAAMGYDVQAAMYCDGIQAVTGRIVPFFYVACEKEPPHAVAVYQASDDLIAAGRAKYRAALRLLSWCRANDRWPAYQPNGEIEIIHLPRWAASDIEG